MVYIHHVIRQIDRLRSRCLPLVGLSIDLLVGSELVDLVRVIGKEAHTLQLVLEDL
jgi:hypothetical protein